MRPFVPSDTPWSGRLVDTGTGRRTTSRSTPPSTPEAVERPLIDPAGRAALRAASAQTRETVDQVLADTGADLDTHLRLRVDTLPQTRAAVRILRGTHPAYHRYAEGLVQGPAVIDAALYTQALDTTEQSGQFVFGFDPRALLSPDFDGTLSGSVPAHTGVSGPRQASGHAAPATEPTPMMQAIEEQVRRQQLDIWTMTWKSVVWLAWEALAKLIRGFATLIENLGTVRIFGKRFGIGKLLAKPFLALAKTLEAIAARKRDEAFGLDPATPDVSDTDVEGLNVGDDELFPDGPASSGGDSVFSGRGGSPFTREGIVTAVHDAQDPLTGESGVQYMMAATQVLTTVHTYAESPDQAPLRTALYRHRAAREAHALHTAYEGIIAAFGVLPLATPSVDDTGGPAATADVATPGEDRIVC